MTDRFKKARTLAGVRADPRVSSVDTEPGEERGITYWVSLVDGYYWDGETTQIHEDTVADVCAALNDDVEYLEPHARP